jgi:hypothetical protein
MGMDAIWGSDSGKLNTGVPLYLLIQYLWFQLSTVYSGPHKKFEN